MLYLFIFYTTYVVPRPFCVSVVIGKGHGKMYSYNLKCNKVINDLQHVGGDLRFTPLIKLNAITNILLSGITYSHR